MSDTRASRIAVVVLGVLVGAGQAQLFAGGPMETICPLALHDERVELEDAELEVDLARSNFAAYEEVFKLIEGLWENDAVERMVYLNARYDRDAARLALERADLVLARQAALVEEYRLACGGSKDEDLSRRIAEIHRKYLRADCDAQAKAIEVAKVNLAFNTQWLESIRELREDKVATLPQVILARLDVEREEKRLRDAARRTEACRAALEPEGEGS